jgi:rod shape-determining protein MreB
MRRRNRSNDGEKKDAEAAKDSTTSVFDEIEIPKEIVVTYSEVAHALDKTISKIEEAILSALEMTPPELSADIYKTGIYLAGGGSMLRGLDKRISAKTKLPVHIAEDPLRAVARGTSIALKNIDKYQFLIRD